MFIFFFHICRIIMISLLKSDSETPRIWIYFIDTRMISLEHLKWSYTLICVIIFRVFSASGSGTDMTCARFQYDNSLRDDSAVPKAIEQHTTRSFIYTYKPVVTSATNLRVYMMNTTRLLFRIYFEHLFESKLIAEKETRVTNRAYLFSRV